MKNLQWHENFLKGDLFSYDNDPIVLHCCLHRLFLELLNLVILYHQAR